MVDSNFFMYPFTYTTKEGEDTKLNVVPGMTFVDEVALGVLHREGLYTKFAPVGALNEEQRNKFGQSVANAYEYAFQIADIRRQIFQQVAQKVQEEEVQKLKEQVGGSGTVDVKAEEVPSTEAK